MGDVLPMPGLGGVVRDVRGTGRVLRVSWHGGHDGLVVLSLWDGARCTGTVRVAAGDVPMLIEALQIGLVPAPGPEVPFPGPGAPFADPGPSAGPDIITEPGGTDHATG